MKPNDKPQDFNIPVNNPGLGDFCGRRVPISYLCWWLGQMLQNDHRPVVDTSGLKGNYDFKLSFLPELPPDFPRDTLPAGFLDRPPLLEAVREQLGLKLQAQRGPVEYLVIDHIQKPSED